MITVLKGRVPALIFLSVFLFAAAFAQEHKPAESKPSQPQAAASQKEQPQSAEHAAGAAKGREGTEHKAGGPGAQLAHASREAAAEEQEDEAAQFKKAPAVMWLSRTLGITNHAAWWLAVGLNFAVVAVVIFVALKKNLPGMFRARTATIQKGIEEARKASEDANRRLADVASRLSKLDTEIAAMRTAAEQDAAAEESRILAAAEEEKKKMVESAKQEIAAAAKLARRELKGYAADLAVTLAEKRIHVDPTTDQAMVRSFVQQLSDPNARKDGK